MAAIARPHPPPASVRLALLFALLLPGIHRTEARISSSTSFIDLPPPPPQRQPPPPPSSPRSPYMYTYSFNPVTAGIIGGFALLFLSVTACLVSIHCCNSFDRAADEEYNNNARRSNERRGVDLEMLDAFPTMTYAKAKELDGAGNGDGALECAVCLVEFSDDDALRLVPICRHIFHVKCIDTWLQSHVTCPVCRSDLSVQPESAAAELPAAAASSTENTGASPLRPVVIQQWNSTGHEAVERYSMLRQPDGGAQLEIRATPTQEQESSVEGGGRNGQVGGAWRWRTLLGNLSLRRASRKQEDREASSSASSPREPF